MTLTFTERSPCTPSMWAVTRMLSETVASQRAHRVMWLKMYAWKLDNHVIWFWCIKCVCVCVCVGGVIASLHNKHNVKKNMKRIFYLLCKAAFFQERHKMQKLYVSRITLRLLWFPLIQRQEAFDYVHQKWDPLPPLKFLLFGKTEFNIVPYTLPHR